MPAVHAASKCGQLVVRLNSNGEPFPAYKYIRISPNISEIVFVVDPGFIPDGDMLYLELNGRTERLDGEIGRGYRLQTRVEEAGTWHYCLVNNEKKLPGGTIQVPPNLRLREKTLTPDQIILQTLVSKWMGTIEEWGPHLKAASESGYNMIHFTPLQRRGHSNSPYSIYNHHEIDPGIFSSSTLQDDRLTRLQETIKWMENELGLLSMIDVVWNHTACDSPWLADHPEAGYTLENSPHLKIAYELDESILRFSASMQEGYHLAPQVNSEADVKGILEVFSHNVLPELALWEYFVVDVSSAVLDLEAIFRKEAASSPSEESPESHTFSLEDAVINDCQYDRHSRKMNVTMVREYFRERLEEYRRMPNESDRSLLLSRVLSEYRLKLDQINYTQYQQYDSKVQLIIHNLTNRMIYERVADHGPKLGPISATSPIVPTYFTRIPKPDGSGIYAFANNGWIWDADPLLNFADPTSDAYFTREVIVWGDCVKLRYGSKPDDSPWLWEFMGKYTAMMATTFHGFRIDNCHSTPLHVANGLLSVARRVRPDLYVCAELFTGSEERDMLFVTRLGLNSLIREAMVAWDTSELGRTTSRYGGQPVGAPFDRPEFIDDGNQTIYGILQSQPHALYMDCTHDNEAPAQRRTAADALSNLAIVAFSTTAIGSVRGYDELVPTYLNLVNEARHYQIPDRATGLWDIRRQLNIIHNKIVEEGMFEIVVEQDYDLLIIRRTNPVTLETLLLLARTAFNHSDAQPTYRTIRSKGCKVVPLLSAQLHINSEAIKEDPNRITGIKGTLKSTQFKILPGMADLRTSDCYTTIDLNNIPPGSILVFSCHPDPLTIPPQSLWERSQWAGIVQVISELDLYDLNMLLYRSAPEENDSSLPMGTYQLPGYGPLAFSGLQGFYSIILKSQDDPRLYSCLSENVKGGDWALDYLCNRLNRPGYLRLKELHTWLKELIQDIKSIKAELKPRLFVKLVCELWKLATDVALAKMNSSLPEKINIVKSLALTSIQLIGSVNSTGLHPAKPQIPCMSAGLPHFSTHHMRCWGRDVFIALPGLMLRTCRFEDAKTHFVAFAGCYFRGLIPNLLDSARRPRYNARDATWWFLHALKRYCKAVSKEKADDLLSTMIPLRFPNGIYVDFDDPTIFSRSIPLKEIVQDILESHAKGIEFKEWNAGPALDSVMRDEGFNIRIRLDSKTGLVFGGNRWNCGTWMDKMGESEKAGNRGIPSTPRDGAAIELIAALDSVLEWLIEDNLTGIDHVTLADGSLYTFVQWRRALKNNFESIFFIPKDPCDHNPNIDPTLVGRRGIYKDTFGATNLRGDYQLRPNMMVAMSLSPDLFNRENAIEALRLADRVLVGPLGMRTLDPEDPAYRPNYDNSDDSMDGQVARGANYHQGPEWVWLYGCHLQAMAKFGLINKANMLGRLNNHWNCLQSNDFAGLPELTNRDGSLCRDSCATQAWSSATILDALYYVQE